MNVDRLTRDRYRLPIEPHRSAMASGLCFAVWLLSAALSGCATPPPPVEPPTPPPAPAPVVIPPPVPACPSCDEQTREIARLRQELATRDVEVRDLRSNQRDQVKILQESTRESTRARVKLQRLATQADAASYIAEVEVAFEHLRSSLATTATPPPLMELAKGILESTAAPFAQGQYGVAMDRAAQAEQLIAVVAEDQVLTGARARVPGELPLQVAITLKVTIDSSLRKQPLAKAPVVSVLKKNSPLVARAYKGGWMYVETADGRAGWVNHAQLGVP